MNKKINSEEKKKKQILKSLESTKKELLNTNFKIYNDAEYVNKNTKIHFICKKCNHIIMAYPHNLINNHEDCPYCGKKHRWTFEELKNKIKELDSNFILLSSENDIKGPSGKISVNNIATFKHLTCGNTFKMRISKFLYEKQRCPNCKINKQKSSKEFQDEINTIYNNNFILIGDYKNRRTKVKLLCKKCGHITEDFPFNFLTNKRCCNFCTSSKKEQFVENGLQDVTYQKEISFEDLKFTNKLYIDFYINNNIYLEIDGIQHFYKFNYFGGEEDFQSRLLRDKIKNNYFIKNNLFLIRVFSEDIDENFLKLIKSSSTTINSFNIYKNILIIKDKKILIKKGLYTLQDIESNDSK
jgi:rubrerythrin